MQHRGFNCRLLLQNPSDGRAGSELCSKLEKRVLLQLGLIKDCFVPTFICPWHGRFIVKQLQRGMSSKPQASGVCWELGKVHRAPGSLEELVSESFGFGNPLILLSV